VKCRRTIRERSEALAERSDGDATAMRSSAQEEFEGKVLPLIRVVPHGTTDYDSGGDRTEEPKVT
jgi:hypothetical protein